jgi:hypothetical protein
VIDWVLVDPVARTRPTAPRSAGERREAGSRKVGFFSNSKQHAAEIQEAIAGAITTRHRVQTAFYTKPNASVGATEELIEAIAQECDVVFTGSGD